LNIIIEMYSWWIVFFWGFLYEIVKAEELEKIIFLEEQREIEMEKRRKFEEG
jgi:hypothetical protein